MSSEENHVQANTKVDTKTDAKVNTEVDAKSTEVNSAASSAVDNTPIVKKRPLFAKKTSSSVSESAPSSAKTSGDASSSTGFRAAVIGLLVLALCVAGAGLTLSIINLCRDEAPVTWGFTSDGNSANFTEGSVAEVAAKVAPSVVSIMTETRTTGWFGQSSTSTSAGTGMIVTADGYILTNKHVIDGANSIKVVLDNGVTYDNVSVAGVDPLNDVAYLKIKDAKDLPTVTLGDSKTLTAGQPVIAIGNALGQYQNTITYGIISGTGRSVTAYSGDYSASENLTDMIQTDAAINAGNSGGPLVNAAGQVIGINTATSSNADGIGFAIPISSVIGMLKNIINNNDPSRAYLGVYYINITPDVAESLELPVTSGAYLYGNGQNPAIIVDGPGDKAGLKEKDIITKVNGVEVGRAGTVSSLIGEYAPGDTVQLTILRDGAEQNIKLTLGKYRSNTSSQKS